MSQPATSPAPAVPATERIVVELRPTRGKLAQRVLTVLLVLSLLGNAALWLYARYGGYVDYVSYLTGEAGPREVFHSGQRSADPKIAIVQLRGIIMGPNTDETIRQIRRAAEDDNVVAMVLQINSPGGLVSDSERIRHELVRFRDGDDQRPPRPIVVSMQSLAASGGYYVAMAAGPEGVLYAEPSTWTGSIGVVLPHFNFTGLMEEWGVEYDPIMSHPLKDIGSPFRQMRPEEVEIWQAIIDDSYEDFLEVVDAGRANLNFEEVRTLATGQIYTTDQALANGLIDRVGFVEDAVDAAREQAGVDEARAVRYVSPPSVLELLTGVDLRHSADGGLHVERLLELTTPRAMYLATGWSAELLAAP